MYEVELTKKLPDVFSTVQHSMSDNSKSIMADLIKKFNPKIYYQEKDRIENSKGFTYQRYNFDRTPKDNIIVLLKGKANKSTLLHEMAHVYLTWLNKRAM